MAKGNLQQALDNINITYQELVDIANGIVYKCIKDIIPVIDNISKNIQNISNDQLREYMLSLSLKAYSFAEIKEKASMKADVAEILRKEAYATEFNGTDGTVAVRENTAQINITDEILSSTVSELVADILKVKLDEIHRIIDTMKTVLMSRLSEAKLLSISDGATND